MAAPIVIRRCLTLEEFHACVELQREVWGEEPLEVEPRTMFVVAAHTGGQVIGAFADDLLIGFILAVAGVRDGRPYLHSHMAAIREAYRNQGIGRKLKLFQREEALQCGIAWIEWTFDPLEVRNAHFNLNRLGAVCRKYLPNLYGVTTSPLHRGLRTDRLLAEWYLEEPNVITKVDGLIGEVAGPTSPEYEGLNLPDVEGTLITVPSEVPYGVGGELSGVTALQDQLRTEFTKWFGKGYVATALVPGAEPAYLLVRGRDGF
jgi:predicted GNAT superfamily acetyltransferase